MFAIGTKPTFKSHRLMSAAGVHKPQDQHVIIFTPTPGYKGQDSFTLSMQEHNGSRKATMSVKVSVTIQ
jgi:hypothetical protein